MTKDRHPVPVRLMPRADKNSTNKLLDQCGDRLLSGRYRCDEQNGIRYRTV